MSRITLSCENKPSGPIHYPVRLSATAATAVIAAIIIATTAAAIITVAAEGYQKKNDDEKPNNIVVIKNIAKAIHKISSLRRYKRRFHQSEILNSEKLFAFPICYHTMKKRKICYRFSKINFAYFILKIRSCKNCRLRSKI